MKLKLNFVIKCSMNWIKYQYFYICNDFLNPFLNQNYKTYHIYLFSYLRKQIMVTTYFM
jgi:hypothetical protein